MNKMKYICLLLKTRKSSSEIYYHSIAKILPILPLKFDQLVTASWTGHISRPSISYITRNTSRRNLKTRSFHYQSRVRHAAAKTGQPRGAVRPSGGLTLASLQSKQTFLRSYTQCLHKLLTPPPGSTIPISSPT